ncbi:hypothetical protein [Paraburkholderia sacchari]|uniref:hypothetical protein n=1 Tax=Paraburkholderia sacchari TaxID=159450 RepID=UPI001BCACC37|nr:hypothetical protein [Paraburkholderia sacchari]
MPSHPSVSWVFTQEQFAVFEGFFEHELALGTSWFQVRMLNGMGVSTVVARFTEDPPYKAATLGDSKEWFQVTAALEVKRMPVVDRDTYDVIAEFTADEIDQMGDPLHVIVHVELPGPKRWD